MTREKLEQLRKQGADPQLLRIAEAAMDLIEIENRITAAAMAGLDIRQCTDDSCRAYQKLGEAIGGDK